MLIVENDDQPGVIGEVGTILGRHGVNIANFALGRGDGGAIGVVNVDEDRRRPARPERGRRRDPRVPRDPRRPGSYGCRNRLHEASLPRPTDLHRHANCQTATRNDSGERARAGSSRPVPIRHPRETSSARRVSIVDVADARRDDQPRTGESRRPTSHGTRQIVAARDRSSTTTRSSSAVVDARAGRDRRSVAELGAVRDDNEQCRTMMLWPSVTMSYAVRLVRDQRPGGEHDVAERARAPIAGRIELRRDVARRSRCRRG